MFEIEKIKTTFAIREEAIKKIEAKLKDEIDKSDIISQQTNIINRQCEEQER